MLFNSIQFFYFLAISLLIYWLTPGTSRKLTVLTLLSLVFYTGFSLVFTGLLVLTILVDFSVGRYFKSVGPAQKKILVLLSLTANFGPLIFFKLNTQLHFLGLDLKLPLGMSFYTFKSVSYIIDVYRGRILPEKNLRNYALYVSFFPALLSGPVSRYEGFRKNFSGLLERAKMKWGDGLTLIIIGLFKKICVADLINSILQSFWNGQMGIAPIDASTALLITFAISIQLYTDFSGYSDIARGVGFLFGFSIPKNFFFPLWSISLPSLWRKQHITMSEWFRDYVYYPSLTKLKSLKTVAVYLSIFLTFILSGLWHGLTLGCLVFGLTQAVFISLSVFWSQKMYPLRPLGFSLGKRCSLFLNWFVSIFAFSFSVLFLLSPSAESAAKVALGFVSGKFLIEASLRSLDLRLFLVLFIFLLGHGLNFLTYEASGSGPFRNLLKKWKDRTYPLFLGIALVFVILMSTNDVPFIYYQF